MVLVARACQRLFGHSPASHDWNGVFDRVWSRRLTRAGPRTTADVQGQSCARKGIAGRGSAHDRSAVVREPPGIVAA